MVAVKPTHEQIQLLRAFVDLCQKNPEMLHIPELQFYRQYLESLGARIPPPAQSNTQNEGDEAMEGEEDMESDLELDNTGVIEPDEGMDLPAGDENAEVTEEMLEQSDEKRRAAVEASNNGDLEGALKLYTEAICLNPGSALLHAKRAGILISMKKPVAAIRDCDKAIALNPNVAQPYKFRGWAYRLIGRWEEAHHDLCLASKLDCDEQVFQWLKEVEPNAKKLLEHKRKQERKASDKKARQEERSRRPAQEQAKPEKTDSSEPRKPESSSMPNLGGLFSDPELLKIFQDPELAPALQDIMANPSNMFKYMNNPKFATLMNIMKAKFMPPGGAPAGGAKGAKGGAQKEDEKGPTMDDVD